MSVQASRTRRRNEAILWVHGRLGRPTFTTHEMWELGRSMLNETWPPYTKSAWRRMARVDILGQALTKHPAFERDTTGDRDGLVDLHRRGERTRSYTWRLRE